MWIRFKCFLFGHKWGVEKIHWEFEMDDYPIWETWYRCERCGNTERYYG